MAEISTYTEPGIDEAQNPTIYGYHHGPIPNPNPGWVPLPVSHARRMQDVVRSVRAARAARRAAGQPVGPLPRIGRVPPVTETMNCMYGVSASASFLT
jgi:hypothetical protein